MQTYILPFERVRIDLTSQPIFDAKLQDQEKMLAIQKCPCLEVQK